MGHEFASRVDVASPSALLFYDLSRKTTATPLAILSPTRKTGSQKEAEADIYLFLISIAYLTNPTSASFRTHLTSLSFHTHLRRLSTPTTAPPNDSHTPHIATGSERRPKSTATIRSPGHVLSFSNRISLSVLTPPYTLRSYGFFSTVLMSTSAKKSYTVVEVVGGQEKRTVVERPVEGVWIGVFGGWYRWKRNGDITMEEEDRKERLQSGVAAMEAEDEVEEDDHGASLFYFSFLLLSRLTREVVNRPFFFHHFYRSQHHSS